LLPFDKLRTGIASFPLRNLSVIASKAKQSPLRELEIASAQKTVPRNDTMKFLMPTDGALAMADSQ